MDSLTHIALGACIGEAFAGKTLGKKAMLWGIVLQSIPDFDFICATWMSTTDSMLAHRGFTHSFLFCFLLTLFIAWGTQLIQGLRQLNFQQWFLFAAVSLGSHIFIDAFNNYGVGWFEPFSHQRISFNSVYVADPFFAVIPAVCTIVLLFKKAKLPGRKIWWKLGLIVPAFYLCYSVVNKMLVERKLMDALRLQQMQVNRCLITPAPLQNWLWFVAAETDSGYYCGYRSVFDAADTTPLQYFPKEEYLLTGYKDRSDIKNLLRFSQGYFTVEKWQDTLVLNDLRFGQIIGWVNPRGRFAFHYFINHPDENKMAVQRGRFAGWNKEVVKIMLQKIAGN